jgi:hypothetical protein
MSTKGSAAGFVAKRSDHLHSESRDGHQKVRREFTMKKWSEYNLQIKAGDPQTTIIHSAICLNNSMEE